MERAGITTNSIVRPLDVNENEFIHCYAFRDRLSSAGGAFGAKVFLLDSYL